MLQNETYHWVIR